MEQSVSVEIVGIRASGSGEELALTVMIRSGEHSETRILSLTTGQYRELKPAKGPVTQARFEQLEQASRMCAALRCGERLLAYGSNSAQLLGQKLRRRGFTQEEARAAAEQLGRMGLIDEESDMRREVEKCLRKLWGAGRIRSHLRSRGFDREVLDALPDILEEIDFAANCAALLRKHYGGWPDDPAQRRRVLAGLYRYGYTPEEIRQAARLLREER